MLFLQRKRKKQAKEVSVFSDWARLNETSVTPYIHNKYADAFNTDAGTDIEQNNNWGSGASWEGN